MNLDKAPGKLTVTECNAELQHYGIEASGNREVKRKLISAQRKIRKKSRNSPSPTFVDAPDEQHDAEPAAARWQRNEYIRLGECLRSSRLCAVMGALMNGHVGEGVDQARHQLVDQSDRWLLDDKNSDSNPELTTLIAEVFNDPSFQPPNACAHIEMCANFEPNIIYAVRTPQTLKVKIRDIKKMNTVAFKEIFKVPSGTNQKPEVTEVVAKFCSQQEAPLVAYFATIFDGDPILDFMHKGLGNDGFEELDDSEDDSGLMGAPDPHAARPAGTRIEQTTLKAHGTQAVGPTRNDLIYALRQTDTTKSFLSGLREIVRPEPVNTTKSIDPELKQWMALRPNLSAEHQAMVDDLASRALQQLRSRLEVDRSAAPMDATPVAGVARTTQARAFSG
eukprot:SAG31_NODE_8723_length_1399_cov_1.766923_1_plen_391_part_10